MPANNLYRDYIEIDPSFESVVNLQADQRNANLWKSYIVGQDMENLVDVLCRSINNEVVDARRHFWIHGSYGTGKSYAAIVVKHLLEEKKEVVDDYLGKQSRLSAYRNRFARVRGKGDYLVVWKMGCTGIRDGNALLMAVEMAVREALTAKFGDKADYGDDSLRDAVLAQLNNKAHNWDFIISESSLRNDYPNAEILIQKVQAGDLEALRDTAKEIRDRGWALVDSLTTFKKWIGSVIDNNGLSKSGIFMIWDEFTNYVTGSDDHEILQQLSEYSKEKPFYMLYVVHRAQEMLSSIGEDKYQKISDRLHQVEFRISPDASYDLIAGSICIKNGMKQNWEEERRIVVSRIRNFLPDMEGADDKIAEMIDDLCPMHPMTIRLLSRVADSYAAAQRTMFRFMKDTQSPDQGFASYISKYGPDSQACWLTPDWLWDYFFAQAGDLTEKDLKVADYVHNFESKRHLVESDENALRVYKTAMLLMTIMSNTRGFYGGRRAQDGIAATVDCLKTCLAGVVTEEQVDDKLEALTDSKVLVIDKAANGVKHLQLPYAIGPDVDFSAKLEDNDKKYSRYMLFSKDGAFSKPFEEQAWDNNDAVQKRMKIAVCCAETRSIELRLKEVLAELEKAPYKLGLLVVTVRDEVQANAIQADLQKRTAGIEEPRLTIALNKQPLTDDVRKRWLDAITRRELASAAGATGDAKQKEMEAQTLVASWVQGAINGGRMIAWNGTQVINNIYGMADLRRRIQTVVLDALFPYAPETICRTATAYRSCNVAAVSAGISRESSNQQMKNVLDGIRTAGGLDCTTLEQMMALAGNKQAASIAALAKRIHEETERTGARIALDDLWKVLQGEPFGYYNTITCGVLLGYVFSTFKSMGYTWTDSSQASHVLSDSTLNTLVGNMCAGKLTTDFLFAGTETWRAFREYLKYIFKMDDSSMSDEMTGNHNVREQITKNGAPFWALKYLPKDSWVNEDNRQAAEKIIDCIQQFVSQEGDSETVMSTVVQTFQGRGRVKKIIADSFQDKNIVATAFRDFLYGSSSTLQSIATKMQVQPQELSDKLHAKMQTAIYTWTEAQVSEKLEEVVNEYRYLDVLGAVVGTTYRSGEAARDELKNRFNHFRISLDAIKKMNLSWFAALEVLHKVSLNGVERLTEADIERDITILEEHGVSANATLCDPRPVLAEMLVRDGLECSAEELDKVYGGLKGLPCDMNLSQFERELNNQKNNISMARNRIYLKEKWSTLTGTSTVKAWCNGHGVPLPILVSKQFQNALSTLIDVQNERYTSDGAVKEALSFFDSAEVDLLLNDGAIEKLFIETLGAEYKEIWNEKKTDILAKARMSKSDLSSWTAVDLMGLQKLIKQEQQIVAKREKLAQTKAAVEAMAESRLKEKVQMFLDVHPEFCDNFSK